MLSNPFGIGSVSGAKAKTSQVGRLSNSVIANLTSRALMIEQMPIINLRIRQTTNLGVGDNAIVSLQAMNRMGQSNEPEWFTLNTFMLPAGGLAITPYGPAGLYYPASLVRVTVSSTGILADTIVEYYLTASA